VVDSKLERDALTSAASISTGRLDPDEVARFAFRVWSYKQGEMVSLLIHLGDRLGLYRVLDGAGAVTAQDWPDGRDCTRVGCASGFGATRRPTCWCRTTGSGSS
jgi:hypothetical protein